MSDPQPAAVQPENAKAPAEWKPEPRTWTWKDLFTAPMLAFKPKAMLVSALTLIALGLWVHLFGLIAPDLGGWYLPTLGAFLLVGLAVFGLGATFVAVFMKADLLDDEFLSFGEAVAQFKSRALAAVLVPVFLAVLVVLVHALLVWLPMLVGSIPYAGGLIYGLLYPLGFFASIFALLLALAVAFSMFVFPAIVAVRRHGWFDNVVDTIEAVGTRPHILVASLALTGVFAWFAYTLSQSAGTYLRTAAIAQPTWGSERQVTEPTRVEDRAQDISIRALRWIDPVAAGKAFATEQAIPWNTFATPRHETEGFYRWGSGLIAGFWQTLIGALVLGYCLNLFIGGGMLTYLVVREDDYWDDEDLEDLDKLAKELEEEAKREEAGQPAAAPASVPAPDAKPVGDGTLPTQMIPPKGWPVYGPSCETRRVAADYATPSPSRRDAGNPGVAAGRLRSRGAARRAAWIAGVSTACIASVS